MTAIATGGIVSAAVIEITGLAAFLALLVPFIVLVIVIMRLRSPPQPSSRKKRAQKLEPLQAVPAKPTAAAVAQDVALAPEPPRPLDWPLRISSAEAANDQAALAGLYLSYAKAEIAEGRGEAAAGHLQTSLRIAAKIKNKAIQAEARLELAEQAREAGDLTTACEHWQIARALFHDLKDERVGKTETLMQKHGCPTDWVLNDF